jgi:hypothetical protein
MPQCHCAVQLLNMLGLMKINTEKMDLVIDKYETAIVETSGAIQRYVPVSAVIISVTVSSLAKPRSTSLTVL